MKNIYNILNMSLVKSQKIHLYEDEKATDKFEIIAQENDVVLGYVGEPLKIDGDLQYKSGVWIRQSCSVPGAE
jgi:hypothetical protein